MGMPICCLGRVMVLVCCVEAVCSIHGALFHRRCFCFSGSMAIAHLSTPVMSMCAPRPCPQVQCLGADHNPDMMLLAARALTFMADVLPVSCGAIVRHGAVPAFCQRLLTIEYIDLAEQSLQVCRCASNERCVQGSHGLPACMGRACRHGWVRVAVSAA